MKSSKKLLVLFSILILGICNGVSASNVGVKEKDGTPNYYDILGIQFENGSLSVNHGTGEISLTYPQMSNGAILLKREGSIPAAVSGKDMIFAKDNQLHYQDKNGNVLAVTSNGGVTSVAYTADTNNGLVFKAGTTSSPITTSGTVNFSIDNSIIPLATGTATFTNKTFLADNGTVSAPTFGFDADTNTGVYRIAADTIGFTTGGAEAARIGSTGNVGIANTNPTQKLTVNGSVLITGTFNGATLAAKMTIPSAANGDILYYDSSAAVWVRLPAGTHAQTLKTINGQPAWR